MRQLTRIGNDLEHVLPRGIGVAVAVDEQKAVRSFADAKQANERTHYVLKQLREQPLPTDVNFGSADVEHVVEVDGAKPVI